MCNLFLSFLIVQRVSLVFYVFFCFFFFFFFSFFFFFYCYAEDVESCLCLYEEEINHYT